MDQVNAQDRQMGRNPTQAWPYAVLCTSEAKLSYSQATGQSPWWFQDHAYISKGYDLQTANSPESASMRTVPNTITDESPEGTSWLPRLLHPPSPGSCRYRHSWTLCLLLRHLRHPQPQSPIYWPTSLACLLPITGSTCDSGIIISEFGGIPLRHGIHG